MNCFPTQWQRVIFRNYGFVKTENIAKILDTDVDTIILEAERLGLKNQEFNPDWLKKGYVTIIRNNWDILPNEQTVVLLETTLKDYQKLLVEYDFLDVKLGKKPNVESVKYSALNEKQIAQTEEIRKEVENNFMPSKVKPFDFFFGSGQNQIIEPEKWAIEDRFTSHYYADYSSVLLDDELKDYSEEYLIRLSNSGVNGLWFHESLKNLSEFPFDTSLSEGYEKRVKNLNKLVERCKKYGVNIYLYLNEPRSLSYDFFEKYPHLKGQECPGGYCLCTSVKEVQDYLYNAVKSLAQSVPHLKGIMTITMSENPTHCYARPLVDNTWLKTTCPNCIGRSAEEVASEVNNIIARGLRDGNGYTKLIANLWGWASFCNWTDEMIERGIKLLDKDIEVLCVSEFSKKFNKGGVDSEVIDYSISVVGPSDITVKSLKLAKENGHRIWAKIQANNSWECAGVPFIPAFDLMVEHIENLKKLGIEGLMLGWSLGGFPGGALPLCVSSCAEGKVDTDLWYSKTYEDKSDVAKNAIGALSKAFKEFPFSVEAIYFGGQNMACGNLFDLEPDNKESTMVCFAYDDYEKWSYPYGIDVYISQMEKLVQGFKDGLKIFDGVNGNLNFEELKRSAEGTYLHMSSTLNLAKFAKFKRDKENNKQGLIDVCVSEMQNAKDLYRLMGEDAKIGYEVTNHYFYDKSRLLEKIINLKQILTILK